MRIHLTILLHLQRSLSQRRHTKVRTAPIRSILLLTLVATRHRLTRSIQTFSGRLRQRISLPLHLIPTQLSILSAQTLQQTLILLLAHILLPMEFLQRRKLHFLLLLWRLLRILIPQLTHLSPIRLLARQLLAVVLLSISSLRFIYLLSRAPLLSILRTLLQRLQHDLIARIFILALTHHPTLMLQLQRLQIRLFRAVHLRLRPLQTTFFLLLVILLQLLLPLITRSQIQLIPVTLPLQMLSVHRHQTSIILRIRQRTSSILRAQIFHALLALLVQLLFQRSTLLSFTFQEWVSSLSTTATMSRAVSSAVSSTAATIASTPIIIQIERVNPLFARCQCQLRQVIDVLLSIFQAMKRTAERSLLRLQLFLLNQAINITLTHLSHHTLPSIAHISLTHIRGIIRIIVQLMLHSLHITLFAFHHQFRILLFLIRIPQLILQRLRISLILQLLNVAVYRLRIVVDEFPRLLQRRMICRHQTLQLQQSFIPLLIRESLILHASTQLVYLCHLLSRLAVSLLRRTRYLALQSRLAFLLLVRFPLSIRQVTSPRLQQRHHTQQRRQPSHQPPHRRQRHHSVQTTHRQSRQRHSTSKQPLHSRSHSSRSRPPSLSDSTKFSRHSVQSLHHKVTLLPCHQELLARNHHRHHGRQYRQLRPIASHKTTSRHHRTTHRHRTVEQRHIDRRQLLPQLHTHIRKLLLRLLQLSLQRIVSLVILIRHARPLAVSLCCLRLSRTHQVQIVRKRRQSLSHTSPRQVHLLQHRSHVLHAPMRFQRLQKLHHSSIRIRLEGF